MYVDEFVEGLSSGAQRIGLQILGLFEQLMESSWIYIHRVPLSGFLHYSECNRTWMSNDSRNLAVITREVIRHSNTLVLLKIRHPSTSLAANN